MPVIHRGVEDAWLAVHGADVTAPQVTVQDRRRDHTARLEPFRHLLADFVTELGQLRIPR